MTMYYEVHGYEILPHEGEISYPAIGDVLNGGSTILKAIANFTNYPILVKSGYDTVANGRAEDIVCPPKANIRLHTSGGPRDFAGWVVEPLQEIADAFMTEVNFRG